MSNLETLDVGQANELKLAFRRTGWTNEEVKRLCEGDTLADLRKVLLGHAEVKPAEHVINCDADPFVPSGWKVEEHQKGGQFRFDPTQVEFWLSEPQRKGKVIEGVKLRKGLAGKPVLNANVLDYLLAHPHLIPEEWKRDSEGHIRYIFFWGTIYRRSDGGLCVRYVYWDSGRWSWSYFWLDYGWDVHSPAALRAD
ncbi:MAG: hypothetical protein HYT13_02530 [Candidatus Liptonbacteria bacterium]|nr:hypothetical protein [Candidatus Liptonbacteria bacterium]